MATIYNSPVEKILNRADKSHSGSHAVAKYVTRSEIKWAKELINENDGIFVDNRGDEWQVLVFEKIKEITFVLK